MSWRDEIEERLLRACKTLRSLPDPESKFQAIHNCWPDVVRDPADAYGYSEAIMPRFRPTPADVSDCLTALEWVRGLDRRDFRLIWWRSLDISFHHIGLRIGRSEWTAQRRYRDILEKVARKAFQAMP